MKKLNLAMIIVWCVIASLIVGLIISGIFWNRAMGRERNLKSSVDMTLLVDEAIPIDGIQNFKIEIASEICFILDAADDNITVKQYGSNLPDKRLLRLIKNGDELTATTILNNGFGSWFFFGLGRHRQLSKVEIYLPKGYENRLELSLLSGKIKADTPLNLSSFNAEVMSGDIEMTQPVKAGDAIIDVLSGNFKLSGLDSESYILDVASGKVNIGKTLKGSGEVSILSGRVDLDAVDITDDLTISVSSGSLNVGILGDPGIDFIGERLSGSLKTYFETRIEDSHTYKALTGAEPYKKINVDITSGAVNITKAQ